MTPELKKIQGACDNAHGQFCIFFSAVNVMIIKDDKQGRNMHRIIISAPIRINVRLHEIYAPWPQILGVNFAMTPQTKGEQ